MTSGGVEYAFELAGSVRALELAYRITRRGGTTVTAGLPPPTATFALPAVNLVAEERTLKGSYIGTCVPSRDIPRYIEPVSSGSIAGRSTDEWNAQARRNQPWLRPIARRQGGSPGHRVLACSVHTYRTQNDDDAAMSDKPESWMQQAGSMFKLWSDQQQKIFGPMFDAAGYAWTCRRSNGGHEG